MWQRACKFAGVPAKWLSATIPKLGCASTSLLAGVILCSPNETGGVEGTVSIGNRAFAGVEVEASSASLKSFWETSTDRNGHYSLDGMRSGQYTMWAEVSGHGCIVAPHVLIPAGKRIRKNLHFVKGKTYPGCQSLRPKKPL